MPAVLLDGRIAGKWKRKNSKVMFEMFETVCAEDKKAIVDEAERYLSPIKKIEWI